MDVPTGVGTLAALALAAPCFSAAMSPPIELSHGGEWEWAARGSCVSGGRFDDASGCRRGVWLAWAQRCCWSCRQLASCLAVGGMIGEPAGLGAGTRPGTISQTGNPSIVGGFCFRMARHAVDFSNKALTQGSSSDAGEGPVMEAGEEGKSNQAVRIHASSMSMSPPCRNMPC
ncbi:hypothetical protein EDB80DRAFT_678990 [Ilyonectria destructans]|nr:hypothetical protein EDB80DRAFT_678990 [Ilyonectria destructans]